jgi:hypothetical protein
VSTDTTLVYTGARVSVTRNRLGLHVTMRVPASRVPVTVAWHAGEHLERF